jgi:hypothetical protein
MLYLASWLPRYKLCAPAQTVWLANWKYRITWFVLSYNKKAWTSWNRECKKLADSAGSCSINKLVYHLACYKYFCWMAKLLKSVSNIFTTFLLWKCMDNIQKFWKAKYIINQHAPHFTMELAVDCFTSSINQLERVAAISIHMTETVRRSTTGKQERHLVSSLRS